MRWAITLFVLVVAWPCCLQAQEPAPSPESAINGSITGRVVSDSGQPLANAIVYFGAANRLNTGRTTTSDADGNFRATGLEAGLYRFSAALPTYTMLQSDPDLPTSYYRLGDTVRIDLIKGGILTGTVVNASGEPVIAVHVRPIQIRDVNGKPTNTLFGMAGRATDDRGIYRIYGLAPGTYIVEAGSAKNQFAPSAYDFDSPTFSPSANRDTAAETMVRSGEESTADIRYRGEPGHTISGTVKLRPGSTAGATITLTAPGDGMAPTASAFQLPGARGFSFSGIADGEYDLIAQESVAPPNQQIAELALSEPKRVNVRGGDVTGIELTTNPLSTINGKVVLEASKLPECQNKRRPSFQETVITLARNQKDEQKRSDLIYFRMYGLTSFPNKDGVFIMSNLRPAQYAFSPRFFARYWYLQSISIGASASAKPATARVDAARNWTTIKTGESVTGLTITLAEGAASVRGHLNLGEGTQASANLKVYLVPADRERSEDPLHYFVSDIGGDGSFVVTNLPPGNYLASVQITGEKDPTTNEKLRLPDATEARLKIHRAAESAKVNLELKPCQHLTDYKLPWKPQ